MSSCPMLRAVLSATALVCTFTFGLSGPRSPRRPGSFRRRCPRHTSRPSSTPTGWHPRNEPWARYDPSQLVGKDAFEYRFEIEDAQWWQYVSTLIPKTGPTAGTELLTRSLTPVLALNGEEDPQDPPRQHGRSQGLLAEQPRTSSSRPRPPDRPWTVGVLRHLNSGLVHRARQRGPPRHELSRSSPIAPLPAHTPRAHE